MSDITASILWKKGYRINARGQWYLPTLKTGSEPPRPVVERHTGNEPNRKDEGTTRHAEGRVRITYTCYKVRLMDPENVCTKYFTDALRYFGIINDDRPQDVEILIRQVTVRHMIDEHTEVTIEPVALHTTAETSGIVHCDPSKP